MRNNNPDIVIHELIERKAKKGRQNNYSTYQPVLDIIEFTEYEKKVAKFHNKQIEIEKGGEFVVIKKGLSIFIKAGENKEDKIFNFLNKLRESEKRY